MYIINKQVAEKLISDLKNQFGELVELKFDDNIIPIHGKYFVKRLLSQMVEFMSNQNVEEAVLTSNNELMAIDKQKEVDSLFKAVVEEAHIAIFDAGKYGKYIGDLQDHDIKIVGIFEHFGPERIPKNFEIAQMDYFFEEAKKQNCSVFMDIGSNYGRYAIYAGKQYDFENIYAFEPTPRTGMYLQFNFILNDIKNVKFFPYAVSDSAGFVEFVDLPHATGANGILNDNVLLKSRDVSSANFSVSKVESQTIDNLFSLKGENIAIKIDTEGHECSVIKGMENLLKRNDCFLQIESFSDNKDQLINILADFGYKNIHKIHADFYFKKA